MNKILAIIVTYNRLPDLKICIQTLKKQNYMDFDILVVNNGSTDGTKEFLDECRDVISIHQENLGGAGGFNAGQQYALEHGYDWVWMMDDDGVPHEDQLQNLLVYAEKSGKKFLNALVIDKDDHSRFAFYAQGFKLSDVDGREVIEEFIHPFNGTFIHRSVLETAGLVKKEMFIWGDEIELTMRYRKHGFEPVTVCNAIHYHPKEKGNFQKFLNMNLLIKPERMSAFYYRNQGYIHGEYFHDKWYKGWKPMVYYTLYYLSKLNVREACKVLKFYIKGMKNDYSDRIL